MLHRADPPRRKAEAAGAEAEPGAGLPEANLRDRLRDIAWPIGVSLGALLLWEALCRGFGVRPILLPPPSAILTAMVSRGDLLFANLWPSVCQTVLAFLLSVVGGVILGILITYSVTVRKGFYPLIVVSQVVPKISITLAIIGVIVSEFVASQRGIGYLIKLAGGLLDTPLMMAAITELSIAGLALYGIIAWVERHVIYWQPANDVERGVGG